MADYRLPMDVDGVKYHGTVDQNEENPGQFMYGLDENGNKRIIRTDEQGNVLTQVTGSIVVEELEAIPGRLVEVEAGMTYELDVYDWRNSDVVSLYYALGLHKPGGISDSDYKIIVIYRFDLSDSNVDNRTFLIAENEDVIDTRQRSGGGTRNNIILKPLLPKSRVLRVRVENLSDSILRITHSQRMGVK